MRVLIVSWEYPPHNEGGLGRHVTELVPALAQQGLDVHVVTPALESTIRQLRHSAQKNPDIQIITSTTSPEAIVTRESGIVAHRVGVPQHDTADDFYKRVIEVNKIIETYLDQIGEQYGQWDVVHIHDWLTGFVGLALKQARALPLVVTIHATERGRFRGYLANHLQWSIDKAERGLIHEADTVIICSRFMLNELQSSFQTPASKLNVVPNGVDVDSLHGHQDDDLDGFRAKYAGRDERIVFTVSRLVYEKGVHDLVEATPGILARCPAARIIVAGRGPEAENLKQQAEHLGVADKVSFVGFISNEDRNRLFKIADCAVFPSLYEPFGIVALEAMALECPLVVTDVGGFSEVVTHEETGITVFPNHPESVVWGVSHTLAHPIWAKRHAIKARQSVEELYNWPRIARLTNDVYRRVLDAHQHHP